MNKKFRSAKIIIAKSAFYSVILLVLIYMYHYNHVGDATFIYNEF
ncbi:MAG: teichoic acid D-Ala incorporation-associated protein DltX [Clostridiales Family XIII bacterium]|jgi:hypothetical protein|nr:teichoic acid D-Ala incorporation-associated protein DltX [Clostridiales Family XIII bacterium]